ncbi:MAG: hypothetical protein AAF738_01680 [Bacteroidota bacterium]
MAQPQFNIKQPSLLDMIVGILTIFLLVIGFFYVAKLGFQLLKWIAPALLIATLIINHKVFLNYFLWLKRLFQKSLLSGIGMTLVTIVFHPVVALLLFFRAFFGWRVRKSMGAFQERYQQQQENFYQQQQHSPQDARIQPRVGEYVTYEEVEIEEDDNSKKQKRKSSDANDYNQFFE